MSIIIFLLKLLRKGYQITFKKIQKQIPEYKNYVQLYDQEANDYIRNLLLDNRPCMISKFGSVELNALIQYQSIKQKKYSIKNIYEFITYKRPTLWWQVGITNLCKNAGFFPNNSLLLQDFYNINIQAMSNIDVLGSYLYGEYFFRKELEHAKKVNLNGFYAPFFYKNPWTKALKGKKVLVIHPFDSEIQYQYKKREHIWNDPEILPEFTLITYKSIVSILGIQTPYNTWFDALKKMQNDICQIDFDIAIIGCGAYGMPLAAFVKNIGKQAIHLAGWTQILFGIMGKRWEENSEILKYTNKYWIRPFPQNVPQNSNEIENGCYW
jgi:hypothetical protein